MARKQKYVNNARLYEELLKRKEEVDKADAEGEPRPQISRYIGECFMSIAKNLANKANFRGYSYRDEMEGDAILVCVRAVDSFDTTKSSYPFGYFTSCVNNAYIKRLSEETKQRVIKYKYIEYSMLNDLISEASADGSGSPEYTSINEYLSDETRSEVVKRFDEKKNKTVSSNTANVPSKKDSSLDSFIT